MKTRQITVSQTRIYSADTIAVATLTTKGVADRLKEQFSFQNQAILPSGQGPIVVFAAGAFTEQGSTYPISALQLGARHVGLQIEARSDVADRFFTALAVLLGDVLPSKPDLTKSIHKTENTTSVTDLDFGLDMLLSPGFREFLEQRAVEAFRQPDHRVILHPVQLAVQVSWVPAAEPSLVKLTEKSLRLEVRQGTRPEERVFFVSCPTDSATHDELLLALEDTLRGHVRSTS